ncbi:unnamed protein product [Urochloa humidicola]
MQAASGGGVVCVAVRGAALPFATSSLGHLPATRTYQKHGDEKLGGWKMWRGVQMSPKLAECRMAVSTFILVMRHMKDDVMA